MSVSSPTNARSSKFRAFCRRVRCWILPPKSSVFLDGRWHEAVPTVEGPAIAIFNGRHVPEWWMLECGRVAEFVGIYDGRPLFFRQTPTQPGELIIGQGIYRVSVRPHMKAIAQQSSRAA
jgi:hypothetical protein